MTSKDKLTLVKDLMIKQVATISPLATIREAMRAMRQHRVKSLVVDKGHPHDAYGIITYTSIIKTIVAEEGDIDLVNVYDVATKPVITVYGDMEVKYVAKLMINQGVRRVVVLGHNELEGMITMSDIISFMLEDVE
jgi:signal-transduction protein with cAMP-binding, CBS, and nucleotidyltransferase domain